MSAEEETDQERRITFCLYESWEKIAGTSGLPALKRLQRQEIEAFKSNLVLLDLRNGKDNPTFQVIGNGLAEDLEEDLIGRPLADVPRRSMLSRVTDHYLEVLANRVPIAFEAEFVNRDGEKALYRGILLPFSDDNQTINFILGGVRWILAKDVKLDEDKPTIEELMRTIASGRDDISLEDEDDEVSEEGDSYAQFEDVSKDTDVITENETVETSVTENLEETSFSVEQEVALDEEIDHEVVDETEPQITTSSYEENISLQENNTELEKGDNQESISEAETIDDNNISNEEVISEEKVVFEDPAKDELDDEDNEAIAEHTSIVEDEPTSELLEQSAEIVSESEEVLDIDDDLTVEDHYLEIDGTTSFEDDIIEELTSTQGQPEEKDAIKTNDLDDADITQQETTPQNTEVAKEAAAEHHSEETVSPEAVVLEERPEEEKPRKRSRKGSVIERSMEMLLGKSKKKDIFGHEIRSAESKITLPKQPDSDEETDLIDENIEDSINEGHSRLISPELLEEAETVQAEEAISDTKVDEIETDTIETDALEISEDSEVENTADNEMTLDTVTVSFEDEINKVINEIVEDTSSNEPVLEAPMSSPLDIEENSSTQPLDEIAQAEETDDYNVEVSLTENNDDADLMATATETPSITLQTFMPEPENEISLTENADEEGLKEETLSISEVEFNEEEKHYSEKTPIEISEETTHISKALENDISTENEDVQLDVTEAEDIVDDAIVIEKETTTSKQIAHEANHNNKVDHEESLLELQDSLKQIIRYIKKEDASHNRSRDSLYNILTVIYKFHNVCEQSPNAYAELVAGNGLKVQERAPFTPVLKICLGKDYDKTRLTEYAAALGIAKHMNVDVDDFHDFIKHFPGGIKGCVKEMRAIRKGSNGANLVQQSRTIEEARNILRDMPVIGRIRLKKMIISKDTDEFCLLLAKRRGHDIDILKVLDDQYTKIDPILKRAAFIKGNLKKEK